MEIVDLDDGVVVGVGVVDVRVRRLDREEVGMRVGWASRVKRGRHWMGFAQKNNGVGLGQRQRDDKQGLIKVGKILEKRRNWMRRVG
jgi:hypothetical protein